MILYDHPASANCMKARILLRRPGLPYERVTVGSSPARRAAPSTSRATPTTAFAPFDRGPGTLLAFGRAATAVPNQIDVRQPIGATDTLRAGRSGSR